MIVHGLSDMFCGKLGNTDDVVLARRRRGRGAATSSSSTTGIGAGAGDPRREGDDERDGKPGPRLRSTADIAHPFVLCACEIEHCIAGRRGTINGDGKSADRSCGDDLANAPCGIGGGGKAPAAAIRCICVRVLSAPVYGLAAGILLPKRPGCLLRIEQRR